MNPTLLYLRRAISNTPGDGKGIDVINIDVEVQCDGLMVLDLADGTSIRLQVTRA